MSIIRKYLFILLLILIILNLNGVLYVFFDIKEAFRYVYLIIAIILILTSTNILRFKQFKTSRYLLTFLFLYFLFGTIATIMNFSWSSWQSSITSLIISFVITFVITDFLLIEMINGNLDYWSRIIFYITLISSFSGLFINFFELEQFGRYVAGYERMAGFFANPNELGFIINMAIIYLLISYYNNLRIRHIALLIILSFASIQTFSKGAIISTIIIWFSYFFVNTLNKHKSYNKILLLVAILVSSIFIKNVFFGSDSDLTIEQNRRIYQVIDIFNGEITDDTTSGRLGLFEVGIEKIKKNPIIGYGIGTFNILEDSTHGVHNAFLLVLGESGVIPFIYLVYFLLTILLIPWIYKLNIIVKFLIVSMIFVIVTYMMGTHGVFNSRFFLLFVSVLAVNADQNILVYSQSNLNIQR